MDNSSAIPLKIQDKAEGARGRYDSIPDKVQEYHKGVPLNGDMKSFYGTTRVQNPVQGKRDMRELGISIDYNKLADNVYEILTRRIIREKERMGGLL